MGRPSTDPHGAEVTPGYWRDCGICRGHGSASRGGGGRHADEKPDHRNGCNWCGGEGRVYIPPTRDPVDEYVAPGTDEEPKK